MTDVVILSQNQAQVVLQVGSGLQGPPGADGIDGASYTHPLTHPPTIIEQDTSNRFVTDAEKAAWGAKQPAGNYASIDQDVSFTTVSATAGMVLPKEQATGIKVDDETPTWGWRDLIGYMIVDSSGANAASLVPFDGGLVRRWAFSATDKEDFEYHIPHDYVPGSDLFIHFHWAHNGTAINGPIVATLAYTYAKGHNQANFSAEKTTTITYNTVNIATTPRIRHRIEETPLSTPGGSATLLNTNDIEPDGVIGLNFTMTTIPSISGGSPNLPFVFFVDVHYQSTNMATKQRSPNFYI